MRKQSVCSCEQTHPNKYLTSILPEMAGEVIGLNVLYSGITYTEKRLDAAMWDITLSKLQNGEVVKQQ